MKHCSQSALRISKIIEDCSRSIILTKEVVQGYSDNIFMHKWLAVGHLAEAADEAVLLDIDLANSIRQARLHLMEIINEKKFSDTEEVRRVIEEIEDCMRSASKEENEEEDDEH